MRKLLLTGILAGLLTFVSSCASAATRDIDIVGHEHGVEIVYDYDWFSYFKNTNLERACKPLNASSPQLNSNSLMVANTISEFLEAYPERLLNKSLRKIYLLTDLNCNHTPYGGTYSGKSIYASVYYYTSKTWLIEALHHEFSSILMKENPSLFSISEFADISGKNSYHTEIEEDCLKSSICRTDNKENLYRKGFINDYCTTSYENDYNVFVEFLFTKHYKLKLLSEQYPLINKKYQMVKQFYRQLGIKL
jgi:hypothetical protein